MGLFGRKKDPVVHPPAERTLVVGAAHGTVTRRAEEYASIVGRTARELTLTTRTNGGWTELIFPGEGIHPWEHHNLGYWLLDAEPDGTPVVVRCGPWGGRPGYWLVRDESPGDWFVGRDDTGAAFTVDVPTGDAVRPDPEATPPEDVTAALAAIAAPADGWTAGPELVVRSEEPGRHSNPRLEGTRRNRRALRPFDLT